MSFFDFFVTKRPHRPGFHLFVILCVAALAPLQLMGAGSSSAPSTATPPPKDSTAIAQRPIVQLGPGDSVTIQVFGQPDMASTTYVDDDGAIPVALVGPVRVSGLSPSEAAVRVEAALKNGGVLVDPHVTITVQTSRSQRISVLGEVKTPGRYVVESNTTILDLLAQAGGITENGASVIYVLRPEKDGNVARFAINLDGLVDEKQTIPLQMLQGGDSVLVPHAERFSIYGEIANPNMYRLEPGMTVVQALARAGGVTARGSTRRIEIKRQVAGDKYQTVSAKLGDPVMPGDVIQVKESIF